MTMLEINKKERNAYDRRYAPFLAHSQSSVSALPTLSSRRTMSSG